MVLEALASHQNVLVRDIPVYKGWLSNGHNAYMEKTNQGFIEKIKGIVDGTLPQLSEAGYETAKQKSIDEIGYELKEVYTKVMNTE